MKKPPIQSHSLWGKLKDRLDPQRSLVVFDPQISEHETDPEKRKLYSDKGLHLWRSYAVANEKTGERQAIWTKRYQLPVSDPRVPYRVFAQWENTLLTAINQKHISSAPQVVKATYVRSPLRTGTTPMVKRLTGISEVQTLDLGPDMDLWSKASAYVEEDQQAQSVLYEPRHLLLFLQATLTALLDHHNENFVHCDLHWGNIALPADAKAFVDPVHGECLSITPRWQDLKLFDWDAGACSHMSNVVPPFIDPWKSLDTQRPDLLQPRTETSNHLRLRLAYLEAVAKEAGANLYDEAFWTACTANNQNHLACLQKLDWRVDLYAVGYWLAKHLRDPDNLRRYNQSKYREHMQFLNGFAEELCRWDLPDEDCKITQEDLMQGRQTPQEWLQKLIQYLKKAEQAQRPAKPHQEYLARIAALLSTAPPAREHWLIRRQDHDADYKKYWDWKQSAGIKKRWRAMCDGVLRVFSNLASTSLPWGKIILGLGFCVVIAGPLFKGKLVWEGGYIPASLISEKKNSAVLEHLYAFPQHPGAVAKARLHAGSADKPQTQFAIGDLFSFTATNPLGRDAYLTVFAADSEDEQAQRMVVVKKNQPIKSMATVTCPSKSTCSEEGFEGEADSWPVSGPAGTVRMVAIMTSVPIEWPLAPGQHGKPRHINAHTYTNAQDISSLFNCASQTGQAAQACQDARQNFAVSPVVTYEVVEAAKPKAAVPSPSSTAQAPVENHKELDGFIVLPGGVARDKATGLEWMRCSLRQTWDGNTCTGEAKRYRWQEALDAAKQLNAQGGFAGKSDWRVPKIRELHGLIYCSKGISEYTTNLQDGCLGEGYARPTIKQAVFPNTPADWAWSSSPSAYSSGYAWGVLFNNGYGSYGFKFSAARVRLVRSGQ